MNFDHKNLVGDSVVAQANLRILATSDLHMNLRAYDYLTETPLRTSGLSRLARVIAEARSEVGSDSCILLDNGDALQGAPMADTAAELPVSHDHPLAQVFNALDYDAVGLGNHDFDFGLEYLDTVSGEYAAPTLSSNFTSNSVQNISPWTILERRLPCSDGTPRTVRIGVLSVMPSQTMIWNSKALQGRADIAEMDAALGLMLPIIKNQGADVVVLLAHSGIGEVEPHKNAENAALHLARWSDVDAVIAGHSHGLFPDSASNPSHGLDPAFGTLNGTPAAMPGFGGSHLAVVDLGLRFENGSWSVMNHVSGLRAATDDADEDQVVLRATAKAHETTQHRLSRVVGQTNTKICSYFSLIKGGTDMAFAAEANRRAIVETLSGTEHAHLPILSSAAAYASGGHAGPTNYVSIDPGDVQDRDLKRLAPYQDNICASVLTGAQVKDWLERSAAIFTHLVPSSDDQDLILGDAPVFNFDILHGVEFTIDPTCPPRFSLEGQLLDEAAERIKGLSFAGRPIDPAARFVVASTNFRLSGGGFFAGCDPDSIIVRTEQTARDALSRMLKDDGARVYEGTSPWQFSPDLGVRARYYTSPDAVASLGNISAYAPVDLGLTSSKYQSLLLTL